MSLSGEIVVYTALPITEVQSTLSNLFNFVNGAVLSAFRTREPDRGWAAFRASVDIPLSSNVVLLEDDQPTDFLKGPFGLEEAVALHRAGVTTSYMMHDTPLLEPLRASITANIPASVRDTYLPNTLFINAGEHDLFEWSEHEEGFFQDRATFSLRFHGYGTPSDWPRFRELALELPELITLRRDLESIVHAPVKQWACWSV